MQYKNYCDSKQIGDNLVAPKKRKKKKKYNISIFPSLLDFSKMAILIFVKVSGIIE